MHITHQEKGVTSRFLTHFFNGIDIPRLTDGYNCAPLKIEECVPAEKTIRHGWNGLWNAELFTHPQNQTTYKRTEEEASVPEKQWTMGWSIPSSLKYKSSSSAGTRGTSGGSKAVEAIELQINLMELLIFLYVQESNQKGRLLSIIRLLKLS